ncbi:hypothetical protein D3C72_1109710 [compost metagenome]
MHQSWMSRIQEKYMFSYCLGTNWMRPSSTAAMAGSASGLVETYHWSVSHGSMTVPERSPFGTFSAWSSMLTSRPWASRSATICLRATKRSRLAYWAGRRVSTCSLTLPSRLKAWALARTDAFLSKMFSSGRLWRLPTS